ncbi:MAG TPA: hypothetical protein DCQ76_05625, partial [Ruminococcaceae bacterium]|nr:hypothetical protein [Oscillospiraceae bacterium]
EGGTKAFVSSGRRVPYPLSERLICQYKKRAVGFSGNLGGTAGFKVLSHIWDKAFFICFQGEKNETLFKTMAMATFKFIIIVYRFIF